MTTALVPSGLEGDIVRPGSAEWLRTVSASKVPSILGISPYEPAFATWHRMAGNLDPTEATDEMRRGHYLEPAVAAWFADQHSEWTVTTTGTWTHPERSWQTASPDRFVVRPDGPALLECKTDAEHDSEWGEPGSDEIPPWYRAQAMWQLDVVGLEECHVAVLLSRLRFQEYVIRYNAAEAEFMRSQALDFLGTIERGEVPPIDGSDRTYQVLRELHPEVEEVDVELPTDLAARFVNSRELQAYAEDKARQVRSEVAAAMGTARRARWNGFTIANRQTRGDGAPFVVAGRKLPTFDIPALGEHVPPTLTEGEAA